MQQERSQKRVRFRDEVAYHKNDDLKIFKDGRPTLWGAVVILEYLSAFVTAAVLGSFVAVTGYLNGDQVTVQTWGPLAVWDTAYNPTNVKADVLSVCEQGSCEKPVSFQFYGNGTFMVTALPRAEVSVTFIVVLVQFLSFLAQVFRGMWLAGPCRGRQGIAGPDWTRWLEYGITSPLMVVVVALSWLAAEQETLLLLVAAQLACVALGQIIEEKLHEILVQDDKPTLWQYCEVWEWHFMSWLFHAAVWATIIMRQRRLSNFISGCTKPSEECDPSRSLELPVEADVILWGTFAAFTLFGVNNVYAMLKVTVFKKDKVSPLGNEVTQAQDKEQRRDAVYAFWTANALRYSVLSLTAKLLLQVSFWFFAVTLQDNKGVDTRLTVQ